MADEAAGPLPHPAIPLGEVTLTAARNERSLFAELASEMPSADRIHIIMAFVREENAGGGVLRDAGDSTAREALFQRASGFDTAYVGLSSLTNWALVDGLEWNVRPVAPRAPHLIERFRRTFDGYLDSEVFDHATQIATTNAWITPCTWRALPIVAPCLSS